MKIRILILGLTVALIVCASFPAMATTVDNMETTSGWKTCNDSDAGIVLNSTRGYADSGTAVLINYDLAGGDWVQIEKDIGTLNISKGDAFRFYWRGQGGSNNLQFKIYDADGTVFGNTNLGSPTSTDWASKIVSFESGTNAMSFQWNYDVDGDGVTDGDSSLDQNSIKKVEFSIGRQDGGSGWLEIDQLELYRETTASAELTFDDFEDGNVTPNKFNGAVGPMSPDINGDTQGDADPSLTIVSTQVCQGTRALEVSFDMHIDTPSITWCGWWNQMTDSAGTRDLSAYEYLRFYAKSNPAGLTMKLQVKDSADVEATKQLNDVIGSSGLGASYAEAVLDLSTFYSTTTINWNKIKEVNFILERTKGISGTIYIDDIRFTHTGPTEEGPISTLDPTEIAPVISGWTVCGDKNATNSLSQVNGYSGKALHWDYDFKDGTWVAMPREWGLNIAGDTNVRFRYKGTGCNNTLELKVQDINDSVFIRKFYNATNTDGDWKTVVIPINDFIYFSGESETIDIKKVKKVLIAVSKSEGGSGTVAIDNLETVSLADMEKVRTGEIISRVSVTNNPFSPDGDGVKDRAIFRYTISDYAYVKFQVFDLRGRCLLDEYQGSSEPGEHEFEWAGYDSSGMTLDNGIYFYSLSAKDIEGKEDRFSHVVGLFR